jgi:hypothetical protein
MDFIDQLKQFAARADNLRSQIHSEEATKTSLILPFFQQVFGYDIFNPDELVPEFTADYGTKKGEKVDYAIFIDKKPCILIEAKWCGEDLDKYGSQLFRYFTTTEAKFGILTNGIIYRFYTDLEEQNKMDIKPFLELNLLKLKDTIVPELKQFCKANFNIKDIFSRASELKYSNEIRTYFSEQLKEPSDDFMRPILSHIYSGRQTLQVMDKFRPIIKTTLNNYISEMMNEKIKTALQNEATSVSEPAEEQIPDTQPTNSPEKTVITTEAELQGFNIVRAILAEIVDISTIVYTDRLSYFVVHLEGSTNKWICRLRFGNNNDGNKYISLPDENKSEVSYELKTLDDIYKYKQNLVDVTNRLVSAVKVA